LDAKQILFAKLERKELLTKHLCTIIEQNEMRKAQKLSELMAKLETDARHVQLTSADSKQVAGSSEPTLSPGKDSGDVANNNNFIGEAAKFSYT